MLELSVRKFGDSLGVVLPREVIHRLHIADGDKVFLIESPDGDCRLTSHDPNEKKIGKNPSSNCTTTTPTPKRLRTFMRSIR